MKKTIAAFLLAVENAVAADLVTPPLSNFVQGGTDTFFCSVLNAKPSPVEDVIIELVRENGVVLASAGPLTLLPNDDRTLIWESNIQYAFCRARGRLSKSTTLLTLCGAESASGPCRTSVAAP